MKWQCQMNKFRNNYVNYQNFNHRLHAGRGAIDMKHIKRDFSLKASDGPLGWVD